jgi:phosphatidate cytidylyltransferase
MLKQRILTAAVLIPAMIAALFYLPTTALAALFGLFVAAGAWEWAALSGLKGLARAAYAVFVVLLGVAIMVAMSRTPAIATVLFGIAVVWWLWALLSLWRDVLGVYRTTAGRLIAGLLVLVPAWIALGSLHVADPNRSPLALLFLLVLVGLGDTAAYAAGHAFGRTKLAPAISPGKTVEGVVGAVVVVLLLAYFCGTMIWDYSGTVLGIWLLLAVVTLLISVLGDLVESKLKRVAGVKDSGTLLPGHGGVLDRIDAVTAAAPLYALGWLIWFDQLALIQ